MAKVNAPLLSLRARGKLADAVVYFPWKGINCVRTYVIPSNPRTTAQLTQRGYMTSAVATWHRPIFTATDRQAWANWATALAAVMTGFNAFCRHYVNQARLTLTSANFYAYTNTVLTAVAITSNVKSEVGVTAVKCWYGLSPTSMINSEVCTGDETGWIATITGLATKTKYYLQWEVTGPAGYLGSKSGIYTETTT